MKLRTIIMMLLITLLVSVQPGVQNQSTAQPASRTEKRGLQGNLPSYQVAGPVVAPDTLSGEES